MSTRLILPLLGCAILALGTDHSFASQPLQCGIAATPANGMLHIEGIVMSDTALAGTYQFAFKSTGAGGSSQITQGGAFTAVANTKAVLGQISVNAGSHYDLDFSITVDGATLDCSKELLPSQ